MRVKKLVARSDLQLVEEQVNGNHEAKKLNTVNYLGKVR